MEQPTFDALLIDFYGTLASDDRATVEAICTDIVDQFAIPLSARDFSHRWGDEFFRIIDACNEHAFKSLVACERESLAAALRPLVGVVPVDKFVARLDGYWRRPPLHADARAFLDALNVPVCCISNADRAHLDDAIALHGLDFDVVVTSECAGCYKPNGRIFDLAVRALGVPPSRLLHIGDSIHSDIIGAHLAGIATGWICRDDRIYDCGEASPDYCFRTLTEFLAIFDRHG